LLLLSVLFCFFWFVQCKREVADNRIKYLGDYNFMIHKTSFELGQTTDTLYSFQGNVSKSGSGQNIFIYYSPNRNIETTLQEDGKFSSPHYATWEVYISGKFESPSKITFKSHLADSHGQFSYDEEVTGNKEE
jgi:hypothetical protein